MPDAAPNPLPRATLVATALQLVMVVTGHLVPSVAQLFPILGTLISGIGGFLAGRGTAGAPAGRAVGLGAGAGALSGVLGVLVSYLLGDVPATVFAIAAGSGVVAGALGGIAGRMTARAG